MGTIDKEIKTQGEWFWKTLSFWPLLIGGVILVINYKKLPPEVPWLYSLPWGEQQLIPKVWYTAGFGILVIINIFNLFIARMLSRGDEVVPKVIWGANLLITLLYLASFVQVLGISIIK